MSYFYIQVQACALRAQTTICYYRINIILDDPPYFARSQMEVLQIFPILNCVDKGMLKLSVLNLLVRFPVLCKLPVYKLLNYVLLLS